MHYLTKKRKPSLLKMISSEAFPNKMDALPNPLPLNMAAKIIKSLDSR